MCYFGSYKFQYQTQNSRSPRRACFSEVCERSTSSGHDSQNAEMGCWEHQDLGENDGFFSQKIGVFPPKSSMD